MEPVTSGAVQDAAGMVVSIAPAGPHDTTSRTTAVPAATRSHRGGPRWQTLAVIVLACGAQVVFSWALVAQHRTHHSSAYDLGFFDQIIWNTAHGRWFQTSFLSYNFAGQHMEPVLFLFAAVYRLAPRVEVLLLTQAAVAAWAALPLYLAARRVLASATAGCLVAAAYLLAPHLHGAVLFDFHPEVMGTFAIFSACALLVAGRAGWALVAVAALFLLKEDAALAAVGFALIVWFCGYRRHALVLLAASTLYLMLVVGVVMPAIRGGPGDLQKRYGYLGTDIGSIVAGAVHDPALLWAHLTGPAQRRALTYLIGTQALLPLAGPAVLAAAPLLAANLLSTHPPQQALTLHYSVLPFALLLVATVLSTGCLLRSPRLARARGWRTLPRERRALVLAGALLLAEGVGWLGGSALGPRRFDVDRYRATPHTAAVQRVLTLVPSGASVSAHSRLLPHLSQRRDVWEFPWIEDADYVLIDRTTDPSQQSTDAGYESTAASLPQRGYCLVAEDDRVVLYQRRSACA